MDVEKGKWMYYSGRILALGANDVGSIPTIQKNINIAINYKNQ